MKNKKLNKTVEKRKKKWSNLYIWKVLQIVLYHLRITWIVRNCKSTFITNRYRQSKIHLFHQNVNNSFICSIFKRITRIFFYKKKSLIPFCQEKKAKKQCLILNQTFENKLDRFLIYINFFISSKFVLRIVNDTQLL